VSGFGSRAVAKGPFPAENGVSPRRSSLVSGEGGGALLFADGSPSQKPAGERAWQTSTSHAGAIRQTIACGANLFDQFEALKYIV